MQAPLPPPAASPYAKDRGTRSGAVTQQRSIPPLISDHRATTDTTIVDKRSGIWQ